MTRSDCRFLLILVLVHSPALSQVQESWVARYDGPGASQDVLRAMTTDDDGNVYVSGSSINFSVSRDVVTIKYTPNGQRTWIARYADATANGLVVDRSGSLYVSGQTRGFYLILKYDSNGNEMWAIRRGTGRTSAAGIAIDSSGNLYVTASDYSELTALDILISKFDSNGQDLWSVRYGDPYPRNDGSGQILVDDGGNAYVLGGSNIPPEDAYKVFILKYDPNGKMQWLKSHDNLFARGIRLDRTGNLLLTGSSGQLEGKPSDIVTMKYDPDGTLAWSKLYSGMRTVDHARDLAVDASGNVYVIGSTRPTGEKAYSVTLKYDHMGNELWVKPFKVLANRDASSNAIAVDLGGNVFVTGNTTSQDPSHLSDFATVKYDSDGNQLWVSEYDFGGSDFAWTIVLDKSGNVHVAGKSEDMNTDDDYATLKYDPEGKLVWQARYNGSANGWEYMGPIAVDKLGNIYVSGQSAMHQHAQSDIVTLKYDSTGELLWSSRYDDPPGLSDTPRVIAVDVGGNAHVGGWSVRSDSRCDFLILKYDHDGKELWARRYTGPGDSFNQLYEMVLDQAGRVYVAGFSGEDPGGRQDYALIKYDALGNEQWVLRLGQVIEGIAVDPMENVYVAGSSARPDGSFGLSTIKFDLNGLKVWESWHVGSNNGGGVAKAIVVDASGNAYVTGQLGSPEGQIDYATVKYDSDGKEIWARHFNLLDYDEPTAIMLDDSGSIYINGNSRSGREISTILKYSPDGIQRWVVTLERLYSTGFVVDTSGNSYLIGSQVSLETGVDYGTWMYDAYGRQVWSAKHDGGVRKNDWVNGIAVVDSKNVYVTGSSFASSLEQDHDYLTVKYSTTLTPFRRGDCNSSGKVNITDPIFLLRYVFNQGTEPPCLSACDANGDSDPNSLWVDAIYLLQFLFSRGMPPTLPQPGCGFDPDGALGCQSFANC